MQDFGFVESIPPEAERPPRKPSGRSSQLKIYPVNKKITIK